MSIMKNILYIFYRTDVKIRANNTVAAKPFLQTVSALLTNIKMFSFLKMMDCYSVDQKMNATRSICQLYFSNRVLNMSYFMNYSDTELKNWKTNITIIIAQVITITIKIQNDLMYASKHDFRFSTNAFVLHYSLYYWCLFNKSMKQKISFWIFMIERCGYQIWRKFKQYNFQKNRMW